MNRIDLEVVQPSSRLVPVPPRSVPASPTPSLVGGVVRLIIRLG